MISTKPEHIIGKFISSSILLITVLFMSSCNISSEGETAKHEHAKYQKAEKTSYISQHQNMNRAHILPTLKSSSDKKNTAPDVSSTKELNKSIEYLQYPRDSTNSEAGTYKNREPYPLPRSANPVKGKK